MGLLTSVPGKTGYVFINRKQCEVKASTPKTGDNPVPRQHHHQAGLWRPNHPSHHRDNNRGYNPPHHSGGGVGADGNRGQVVPHAVTSSLIGSLDDNAQHYPSSQVMTSIYQPPMNAYGRIYNPNYPPMYPPASASNEYVYPGVGSTSAAPIVHLPYSAPYDPMGQGRGNNGGYYNTYPYGQYGNMGYATHNAHNNADGGSVGAISLPSHGEVEYGLGYYEFVPQQPYRDVSSEDSDTGV
jgi:hypothetical protein